MKKLRKGFTLLELLVVIGVMGIMSSLAMVGGQQATDAARATNIADNLEKAASAMMMYYADDAETINASGVKEADLAKGASVYLKTALVASDTADVNTYFVAVSAEDDPDAKWYVGYQFNTSDTATRAMLANRATRMGLYKTITANSEETYAGTASGTTTTYPDTIYMLVR